MTRKLKKKFNTFLNPSFRGCFLTSSLMATIAMSLTIPMTMLADVLLKKVSYPVLFYTGTIPMLIAFLAVTILSHYENWDPVFNVLRCAYLSICRRTRFIRYRFINFYYDYDLCLFYSFRFNEMPSEQTEALIGINGEHNVTKVW